MPFLSEAASAIKSKFGFQNHPSEPLSMIQNTPDLLKSAAKNSLVQSSVVRNINDWDEESVVGPSSTAVSSSRSFELCEDPSFWKDHNVQVQYLLQYKFARSNWSFIMFWLVLFKQIFNVFEFVQKVLIRKFITAYNTFCFSPNKGISLIDCIGRICLIIFIVLWLFVFFSSIKLVRFNLVFNFVSQVVIRMRPLSNTEISVQGHSKCVKQESAQTITWTGPPESRFTFDIVADETVSQVCFS